MSSKLDSYFCPLQETAFPACSGCPFLSNEGGRFFCHLATKNFLFDEETSKTGVFPIVYPREVHCAEMRFVEQGGEKVSQINIADIQGTKETLQKPPAMDGKPGKLPFFKRRKKA